MICRSKVLIFFLGLFLFLSPVLADGTLNVTGGILSAPSYINTETVTPMANMTVNATIGDVNLTGILINITGTAGYGNISGVFVYNDSDNNGVVGSSDALLGSGTVDSNSTSNITFSSVLHIAANTEYYIIIALNISSSATSILTAGVNLTANTTVYTSNATIDNITITGSYIDSTLSQIQDVHATAAISPNYVDTNVTNQSFTYTITPKTNSDTFNNISITIPLGYSIVNLTYIQDGSAALWSTTNLTPNITVTYGNYFIGINYTSGYNGTIIINFTVDTNLSTVPQVAFNSTTTGSNMSSIATTVSGNMSVTTQNLLNITSVSVIKSTAYVNGSDYWEFNFTMNFTAGVTGLLQFKMSNWTDSSGNSISLTSCSPTNCATLRESGDSSNIINLTQNYNIAEGVSLIGVQGITQNVILRMIIPLNTPVSSNWWATYSTLFRSTP